MKYILLFLFILTGNVFAQNIIISGQVIDSVSNEPLKDANFTIDFKRNTEDLKTDKYGNFKLTLSKNNHAISIKYVGYVPYWFYTNENSTSKKNDHKNASPCK